MEGILLDMGGAVANKTNILVLVRDMDSKQCKSNV